MMNSFRGTVIALISRYMLYVGIILLFTNSRASCNIRSRIWTSRFHMVKQQSPCLKLVRTLLNYRVLGTTCSSAAIFLSNDYSLSFSLCIYIPRMNIMLYFICMAPVDLPGARWKRKMQNEKFLLTVGFELTVLRSEVWFSINWVNRT